LDVLHAACERAREGHGRLVLVEGPAGAGKSSLLAAAAERAQSAGSRVLSARGSDLERDLAFGAIRQLFETVLSAAAPAQRDTLLAGAAAPAAWVIAPGVQRDAVQAGAEAAFAVLHGIYWLATNVSLERPLLLVVDDLHWVDASSVRSLAYLARRLTDLRIGLVLAMRPDEPGAPVEVLDGLRAEPEAARITLRPLQPDSVAAIVRASIPAADDALCAACFSASAGNPFYLAELLRTVVTDGGGDDPTAVVRHASIPSIGDRVVRRIARVGEDAVALAHAMAVLDDGGRLADAAALAGLDDAAAATAASHMKRIEVLAGEDPFAFGHPPVRRSVYDALTVAERDAAHAAAADRLRRRGGSREAVAAHLAAARSSGSVAVVAGLRAAAREAMARAAPESAIRWLDRALEEEAPEPPRAVLLHELGEVELFGRDPRAIGHLQEALALATEPVPRARIALDLAEILVAAGRSKDGVTAVSAALDELGDRAPELALELEVFLAVSRAYDSRLVPAFNGDRERLLELARGDSWAARAMAVLLAAIAAARGEDPGEVRALVEHGLRDGRLLAERGAGGWTSAQALAALILAGGDERALEVVEELAAQARRSGALIGTTTAFGYRGWLHARRGELAAAEAEVRTPLDVAVQHGMTMLVASGVTFLLDAILERPSLADLAAMLEALDLEPAFLANGAGAMVLEARGRLRLARGDREGAVADLRACGATNTALGFGPPFSFWRSALALALPPGERDEALALVDEDVARAAATGLARPRGVALRAAGLLKGDDEGLACLHESVTLLEGSSARLEHARSLVEVGAALRRRGQRGQARESLAAGMELAHRCGAERLVARAGEELRAAGARPRRIVRSGVDALTASELRAARLVCEGRSNAEVAQELFVSLKTVETHLSHAYAKLGLTGAGARRRLAAALETAPTSARP
jgi:DNA-binding CsgD family transcriptional regulator/tetratricopeptide (TPR) repeat protein